MSGVEGTIVREKSLVKGLVAGLVGGLVATAAKSFSERMFPPRAERDTEVAAPIGWTTSSLAEESIHWGFGATVGAAYGAIAEYYPAAAAKEGASFGVALGTLTHEGALPAIGAGNSHEDETFRERTSEMTSHVVFGVVAETVRRIVRRLL